MRSSGGHTRYQFVQGIATVGILLLLGGKVEAGAGGGGYTLTATPTQALVGQAIQVCWTTPANGVASSDWIGMYAIGASNNLYFAFQYNTTAATSGCLNFNAPLYIGSIEFRYLPLNLYNDVATSNAVNVLCAFDSHCSDGNPCTIDMCEQGACSNTSAATAMVRLDVTPTSSAIHATISVCWDTPAALATSSDWIAQFEVGTGNPQYVTYQYTGGAASGCLNFTAGPNEGDYEYRYFPQNGNCAFATTETVTFCDATLSPTCPCAATAECNDEDPCTMDTCTAGACSNIGPDANDYTISFCPPEIGGGAPIEVCWTAPAGSSNNDWIGMYPVGAHNVNYLSYQFTGGETDGCRTFTAPVAPGTYEFRYLLINGYCEARNSAPWDVCDGCSPDDFAAANDFVDCLRGPVMAPTAPCVPLDLDCDDNVDLRDVGLFQLQFTGP